MESRYDFYNEFGCGYYYRFGRLNPEFAVPAFEQYVVTNNRGERNAGELGDIAQHEVLRLAWGYAEYEWRGTKNNTTYRYGFYQDPACNYYFDFMSRNFEFNNADFGTYVEQHNRGTLDGAQFCDVPRHDLLRMAYGFAEWKYRQGEGVV